MDLKELFSSQGAFFKFKKKVFVGVDVGVSSIKIVELKEKQGKLYLNNYALVSSSDIEFVRVGTSNVINKSVSKIIKKALEKADISSKEVNVAVPGFTSLIATIDIPQTSKKQANKIVAEEISKYIPVPLEEVVYGWKIISNIPSAENGGSGPMKAVLVAIMKTISNSYQKVFLRAGLKVNSLELNSFSLARVFNESPEDCAIILDIGKSKTNVIIHWEGNVLFDKTIDLAGDKITESISKSVGIDFERAELMKKNKSLSNDKPEMINQVVISALEVLVKEINDALSSFKKIYPTIEPSKIILTGGTSKLKGLEDFLKSKFKQKIEKGNPWKKILFPSELKNVIMDSREFFAIAIGLALADFNQPFNNDNNKED